MALPAMMQNIKTICETMEKAHPMQTVGGVPYCRSVVGTVYRYLAEGKPISEKTRGLLEMTAPFQSALELCLKCGEALQKADAPLSRETLVETLALNWKGKYEIYDMVQRHPFEKIVLPKFPEPEPEPLRNPGDLGLTVRDGRVVVSSRDVARVFEKRHDDVLKSIRSLDCSEAFRLGNFAESSEAVDTGNGTKRNFPIYLMTRDGFVFLAMGYTGRRGAEFKEAYITRFNEMETLLNLRHALPDSKLALLPEPRHKEKVKRYYTPEEAAAELGYRSVREFFTAMVEAGYLIRTNRKHHSNYELTPKANRIFVLLPVAATPRKDSWRRPVVTVSGLAVLVSERWGV